MLILAGVSINAIVGENGVLSRAQYSSFMSEMAVVEEAVQLWKAGELMESKGQSNTAIPANGLCKVNDLTGTERLIGEIGYYRTWSIGKNMPDMNILSSAEEFNKKYEGEFIFYPAGVQDLYYLNNEALELDKDKIYLIDAATSIVYSTTGITLNGVRCYSTSMAKAVMGNNVAPIFAEAEMSGGGDNIIYAGETYLKDKNGNYIDENGNIVSEENKVINPNGFKIISSRSNNLYKLYNNGDLYGKGIKNFSLNLGNGELEKVDMYNWQNFEIPANLINCKSWYQGDDAIYFIDSEDNLWAMGNNSSNQFGLTQEQMIDYTGREAIKLNVDGKKAKRVFSNAGSDTTFVITTDGYLYGAGDNTRACLGIGNANSVDRFTKIDLRDENGNEISGNSIFYIQNCFRFALIWVNKSNAEPYTDEWYDNNEFYISGNNVCGQFSIGYTGSDYWYYRFTKVWDGYYYQFDEGANKSVKINEIYHESDDLQHLIKSVVLGNATVLVTKDGDLYWSGSHGYIGFDVIVATEQEKWNFVKLERTVKENLEFGTNIIKATQSSNNGSQVLWRKNNENKDEIFVARNGTSNNVGMELEGTAPGYFYKLDLPTELENSGIKDYVQTGTNTYFLSNDGYVYAVGLESGFGKNFFKINDSKFVKINFNEKAISLNENSNGAFTDTCFVKLEKSNILMALGNVSFVLGNKVLQNYWIKIAQNVKKFDVGDQSAIYITYDGELFVSGRDAYILGLGRESNVEVNTYEKVNLSFKVKDFGITGDSIGIVSKDDVLYMCGYYNENEAKTNGLGHSTNVFEKLSDKVTMICFNGGSKYYISDGGIYCFGNSNDNGVMWNRSSNYKNYTVFLPNKIDFDTSKLDWLITDGIRHTLYSNDKELYAISGQSEHVIIGIPGSGNRKSSFDFESPVKEVAFANAKSVIYLTNNKEVFGAGTYGYLGIGSQDFGFASYYSNPIKLPINDIVQIVAGNGWYIAVKEDGKVYGTGSNQYGILGRWIGVDRNTPNSRYKTAFEWVECPELEI